MADGHQPLTDSQWQVIAPLLPIHSLQAHPQPAVHGAQLALLSGQVFDAEAFCWLATCWAGGVLKSMNPGTTRIACDWVSLNEKAKAFNSEWKLLQWIDNYLFIIFECSLPVNVYS